jgi:hypothetical protein
MKMLKLTCSGRFRTQPAMDKDSVQFQDFTIKIPYLPEELRYAPDNKMLQNAKRMFPVSLRSSKLKDQNYEGLIKLYIDDVEEIEGELKCAGKDVKRMTWEELQEFACYFKLREVPLYHSGGLREACEKAYETYMKVIKKKKVLKTPNDIKALRERMQRKLENTEYEQHEIDEKIEEAIKDAFNMTENPNNREKSYNFAKLPPLIAIKDEKKQSLTKSK